MIRLQGSQWHEIKDTLEPVSYIESNRGNICIYLRQKYTNKKPVFSHWLNDREKAQFNTYEDCLHKRVWKEKRLKEN